MKIDSSEFEKLLGAVDNPDDIQLLKNWFWRDDNSVPAQYLLQPITSLLPHYRDYANEELRKKASSDWWTAFERMQVVLRMAADKALDKQSERHKYYMSGKCLYRILFPFSDEKYQDCFEVSSGKVKLTRRFWLVLIYLHDWHNVLGK